MRVSWQDWRCKPGVTLFPVFDKVPLHSYPTHSGCKFHLFSASVIGMTYYSVADLKQRALFFSIYPHWINVLLPLRIYLLSNGDQRQWDPPDTGRISGRSRNGYATLSWPHRGGALLLFLPIGGHLISVV